MLLETLTPTPLWRCHLLSPCPHQRLPKAQLVRVFCAQDFTAAVTVGTRGAMEANANLPFQITAVAPEINRKLLADFTGERTGFVQVNLDSPAPHTPDMCTW